MGAAPKLTAESITARLDELPTLPSIVYELSQTINDPMSSTKDVEKIMENDQSLTAKVLKLVNSAYYAIPGGVSSLSRAIAYIGFDTVNQLVLSASIIEALDTKQNAEFNINEFWKHAIGSAIASETIAKFIKHPMAADLFTCGLVHDMGKVALYVIDPQTLTVTVQHAEKNGLSFLEAELALDLPRHTQIGEMLAQKWNLPLEMINCIRHHHTKERNLRANLTADTNRNVDIVYLANLLVHALKFGNSGYCKIQGAPKEVMERLTINPDTGLKPLLQLIKSNLDKASDILRVLGGD